WCSWAQCRSSRRRRHGYVPSQLRISCPRRPETGRGSAMPLRRVVSTGRFACASVVIRPPISPSSKLPFSSSVCHPSFFAAVVLTLFGVVCRPMIGPFGGINEETIHTMQRRFQLLRCPELAIGHQFEMHQGIVQNRRELMQVLIGFRACHRKLLPEHIEGGVRLVIIEDKLQFFRHRWQFPFGTTTRFTPSRAGGNPLCIRLLLG